MKREAYGRRVSSLRQGLADRSLGYCDTLWIIQPENRRYLSGFRAVDGQFTESSGSLLIKDSRSILLTDSRYTIEAENEAVDFHVRTLKQGLPEGFPEVVKEIGTRTLGFEEDYLTCGSPSTW